MDSAKWAVDLQLSDRFGGPGVRLWSLRGGSGDSPWWRCGSPCRQRGCVRGRSWSMGARSDNPPPFPFWQSCSNRRWSKVVRVVSPRCCGNCRWPKAMCMIALYNGGPLPSSTHQEKRDNLHRCCCSSTPSVIGRSRMG
jgi:hypothetical protein